MTEACTENPLYRQGLVREGPPGAVPTPVLLLPAVAHMGSAVPVEAAYLFNYADDVTYIDVLLRAAKGAGSNRR